MIPNRHPDTGATTSDFAKEYLVHCPKCEGKALINTQGRLQCLACFHVEEKGHWYGAATAVVQVKCRECHTAITRKAEWDGRWEKLMVHCEKCGDDCYYDAVIHRHFWHEGKMTDTVFGLPLWLQDDFKGEVFWAFNYDHLEALRVYIGAKLRERGISPRNTYSKNSSMVSRLPDFIKKAKNRAGLLKLMDELIEK